VTFVSSGDAAPALPARPGPGVVELPAGIVEAIVEHARAEEPNEACGLIVGTAAAADGGRALRWEPTRNKAASPFRYEIDPADLLRLTLATDDAGETFWAIVHSHVRTVARPSPTDTALALYPDALYLLVSLAAEMPELRAWRIVDGDVFEVELRVTE
jgi:[CysO sulfur-carrier protein]-S-L-cysteine hydrolase